MTPSTDAGRGDPYWYEWFVGLIEVADLLDPSSGVVAVAFQTKGIKGWDDVVVRLSDGSRRCYQVKHTRAENTLTFGDLVQPGENQVSLLSSLFDAWQVGGLNDGRTKCILYTNREAGARVGTTAGGIQRPPLLAFIQWLSAGVSQASSIGSIVPPQTWDPAWRKWQSQLASGSDSDRLSFLRSLEIRTDQEDLEGLVERASAKLEAAFGVDRAGASHRCLMVCIEHFACGPLAMPRSLSKNCVRNWPLPPSPSRSRRRSTSRPVLPDTDFGGQ